VACLLAGFGLLVVADADWAHAIGVTCLLAFIVLAFGAVGPDEIASIESDGTDVAADQENGPGRAGAHHRAGTRR
jgi:hypothetical protein